MIDVEKIEKLLAMMVQYGVDRIRIEDENEKIFLTKHGKVQTFPLMAAHPDSTAVSLASGAQAGGRIVEAGAPVASEVPKGTVIHSPFVGTFYRGPSPDADFFVNVGSRVRKGQTLCIVEAMKIMNEIESEVDGVVVAITAENGKPVEYNSSLFVIDTEQ